MGSSKDLHIDLHDEFLIEAKEHIDKIETRLLALEKSPEGDHVDLITEVFRAIHSIKGAAGFMGFTNINELSHVMETVLQMMRTGDIQPEPRFIDALLAGLDALKGLLDDLETSNDVNIEEVYDRLSGIVSEKSSGKAKKEMETRVSISDADGVGLEVNQFTLNSILPAYDYLYFLRYDLHELQSKRGVTPVSLVRRLLDQGAVVETKIETGATALKEDLAAVPLMYLVLYAANIGPDRIEAAAGLGKDRITLVDAFSLPADAAPAAGGAKTDAGPGPTPELREEKPDDPGSPGAQKDLHEFAETIRVKVDILDKLMELAGELVLVRNQQMLSADASTSASRGISQRLDIVTTELQETIMRTRMQPLGNVFAKLPRIVRDLSGKLRKQIEISISGSDVELDKTILETLTDPLIHLIRNCCDHGVETPMERRAAGKPENGLILVEAYHEAGQINIRIKDDGKGLDPEKLKHAALAKGLRTKEDLARMADKDILSMIFLPGFSTADSVSDISGRGVGLDVVKSAMEQLGGNVEIESVYGKHTIIHLRLPLTLAIIPCLIITAAGRRYAIPQVNLVELVCLYDDDVHTRIEQAEDQEVFRLRDRLLPMVRLNEVLRRPEPFTKSVKREITDACFNASRADEGRSAASLHFAVVKFGAQRFGLIVDAVLGTEEIVVKPMHSSLKSLGVYSGATVMGDGKVALILDVEGVARHADILFSTLLAAEEDLVKKQDDSQTVLLFQSGEQEQFAVTLPLIRRIEHIQASRIEKIGTKNYITIDGVSTLVLHLDEVMNVSAYAAADEPFLLLPKHIKRPFGILMSRIVDIADAPLSLNMDSYMADGLMGTAIIRDKTTLFLDIFRLIELAEPEWFAERRKLAPPPDVKKRILLVEDASFFRQLVKGYLESDQYEVVTAEDGKEALHIMEAADFDLIVSDLEMPILDGWRFMEQVRKEARWAEIPAVALTALDSESDRFFAEEAGFDSYVIKIDREELLTVIANLLRRK